MLYRCSRFMLLSLLFGRLSYGWGTEGHRTVNLYGAKQLPHAMLRFRDAEFYYADHASDVDRRKVRDEEETYRQFIELERYPEFTQRTMPTALLDLQKKYGAETVRQNGYLPYLVYEMYDSLQRTMRSGNWEATLSAAADLGHYIGDMTMPLNTTMNYDGQLTKNHGIKWRYEIELMNRYYHQLNFKRTDPRKFDSPRGDAVNRIFSLLARSHARVPFILRGDTAAFRQAGKKYNSTYYSLLWKETGKVTNELMQEGADLFAALFYNAWLVAGGNSIQWSDDLRRKKIPSEREPEHLEQNYPNPFNPKTTIKYTLKDAYDIKLSVYNLFGQELQLLFEGRQGAGRYEYVFNGEQLPGGVYFIRLQLNDKIEARKMILAK